MATAHPGSSSLSPRQQFARAVRERFLAEVGRAMTEIGAAVQEHLTILMDEPCNARESQERRDTWMAYKKCRPLWLEGTMKAWTECLDPKKKEDPGVRGLNCRYDVVENKILAPRLVLLMVEQWANSGMRGDSWSMVNEVVQKLLIERLKIAYANANEILIKKGVMPTIELKDRVRSPVRSGAPPRARPPAGAPVPNTPQQPESGASGHGDFGQGGYGQGGGQQPQGGQMPGGNTGNTGYAGPATGHGSHGMQSAGSGSAPERSGGGFFGGSLGWGGPCAAGWWRSA
jgi:hypothetical protein